MKRVLILVIVLVGGAFAYETYTGHDIGVRKAYDVTRGAISGGFAGGYGMATGAGQSIGGAVGGIANGVSNNMGAAFGK